MARRYALIIANASYQDPKLGRLRTPARDAEELARVLRDPAIGDFEVELSVDEPEHALRRRIAAFFAQRDRDDLLLLHFSCHGLKDDSGQLYFAATDTEVAQLDATAISAEFVSRQMTRSRSRKVVALLDCCYSGAIARGLRFRAGETLQLDEHLGGHGRVIMTASSAMEYAFEGDELTGSGQPSVFTSAVVKGLETGEADRDQDHRISVEELYDYVCDQVREITPDQSPNMLSHLEGELYIARSSYVAAVEPAELPAELRGATESPFAGVREGAVAELARLASGSEAALVAAARAALTTLVDDDSRRVAAAAARALEAREPAPQAPSPPDPATPELVTAASDDLSEVAAPAANRLRAVAVPLVGALGALLVLLGLTVGADSAWPDPIHDVTVVASLAALVAVALVTRSAFRAGVALDATAVALAAFPLGVGLAADWIASHGSDVYVAAAPVVTGSLVLAGAALWQARPSAPEGSSMTPADGLLLLGAAALAIASRSFWPQSARASGLLLLAFALAVAVAAAAALCGLLREQERRIARLASVAAPAGGILALASTLTVAAWLSRAQGSSAQLTALATFWASIALTVTAVASLTVRLRARSPR